MFRSDTIFKATLHQCSTCRYTSAVKTNVAIHIISKCPGAQLLSQKRWIIQSVEKPSRTASAPTQDKLRLSSDPIFQAVVHQCFTCHYTSAVKANVEHHIISKCPGAQLLSQKQWITHVAEKPSQAASAGTSSPPAPQQNKKKPAPAKLHAACDPRPGYIYYVTTPSMQSVAKFGRWTGTLEALRSRYATYYPKPTIAAVATPTPRVAEAALKAAMIAEGVMLRSRRELVRDTPAARRAFWQLSEEM
jgi:hypothetical protein